MTDRPYLLIDVDGVLNAICCQYTSYRGQPPPPVCPLHHGWIKTEGLGYPLLLNPAHGPALLALAEETGAELAWGSTWEHHANEHIGPKIGLPPLPYAPVVRGGQKALTVVPWTEGRPFVWLDDDPSVVRGIVRLRDSYRQVSSVNETLGLRDADLDSKEIR